MNTQKAEFRSPEIECDGCAKSIKTALGRMTGVSSVAVNVAIRSVAVEYAAPATEEQLAATLENIGFPIEAATATR